MSDERNTSALIALANEVEKLRTSGQYGMMVRLTNAVEQLTYATTELNTTLAKAIADAKEEG